MPAQTFLRALRQIPQSSPNLQSKGSKNLVMAAITKLCGYGIANVTLASTSDDNRVVLYADDTMGLDRFYVYEVPIQKNSLKPKVHGQSGVTLAFDPPTRHTRSDYLGVQMSFRLVRGKNLADVIDHYKKRSKEVDGDHPDLEAKYNCSFDSGPQTRECGTLQRRCLR